MNMFDPSAPHIIILLIVVLLLFGSRRLPGAAKSLGESMHMFKKSVHGITDDDEPVAGPTTTVAGQQVSLPPAAATSPDQQMADLQRQIRELQEQQKQEVPASSAPGSGAARSEAPPETF